MQTMCKNSKNVILFYFVCTQDFAQTLQNLGDCMANHEIEKLQLKYFKKNVKNIFFFRQFKFCSLKLFHYNFAWQNLHCSMILGSNFCIHEFYKQRMKALSILGENLLCKLTEHLHFAAHIYGAMQTSLSVFIFLIY